MQTGTRRVKISRAPASRTGSPLSFTEGEEDTAMAQQCSRQLLWAGLFCCLVGWGLGQHQGNNCTAAISCAACLQAGPDCAWCKDPHFFTPEELASARCDEAAALERRGCSPGEIENPRGSVVLPQHRGTVLAGVPEGAERPQREGPAPSQPQEVLIKLRVGEPQTVSLSLPVAQDPPVDLYYLMGLSNTTEGPLQDAKRFVASLRTTLRNITSDFRIGFGLFGGGIERLAQENPCPHGLNCSSPLRYRHVLHLTPNETLFEDLLGQQEVYASWDPPGSGSHAILQVAACPSCLGWRRAATRLLLVSTDAGFPAEAGEGDGAGAGLPSDGLCRLDEGGSLCTCDGPPSIAHLAQLLSQNHIQVIFAVTPDVQPVYEELERRIPNSAVETLSSDADSITRHVLLAASCSLSSEAAWESTSQPAVKYQSHCRDGEGAAGRGGRRGTPVPAGEEITFEVTVTATQCPEGEPRESLRIQPWGFAEELAIQLAIICDCPCQSDGAPSSPQCHGSAFACGACKCQPGRYGRHCECSAGEGGRQDLGASCRAPNSSEVCSNNGECVCGRCVCQKRENPEEQHSGEFCQCDNFSCARANGLLCGGHGRCVCGECECWPDYSGEACACPLGPSLCEAPNGQICHGRGACECGVCLCRAPYRGHTCEMGPALPDASAEDN